MGHLKYPRIQKHGKRTVLSNEVIIQEKIDGANLSIWVEDDGIHIGSRNFDVTENSDVFEDAKLYVRKHEGINGYLNLNRNHRLYGEWLIKHTVSYNEDSYNKFYLFDIQNETEFLPYNQVEQVATTYNILQPKTFAVGKFTVEEINKFVGKSVLGYKGEGIVIRVIPDEDDKIIGKYRRFKIVSKEFIEDNKLTFGSNDRRSKDYWEMYVTNRFVNENRVRKIMLKLRDDGLIIDKKLIPRLMTTVYQDVLTEEIITISKKVPAIDFKILNKLISKKVVVIYSYLIDKTD